MCDLLKAQDSLIEPEGDGCGEVDGAEEDVCASVVSRGDASEIL